MKRSHNSASDSLVQPLDMDYKRFERCLLGNPHGCRPVSPPPLALNLPQLGKPDYRYEERADRGNFSLSTESPRTLNNRKGVRKRGDLGDMI